MGRSAQVNQPPRHVVVTGVSSGIGLAIAQRLLANGYRVHGSVRSPHDAARVQATLGEGFSPLLFDVTDGQAIAAAAQEVAAALNGRTLAGLVNNAGVALPGPLLHLPIPALRQQFEVNVTGVLAVTQAFAPLLGAAPVGQRPLGSPGRIVNMSSVSGRIVYPLMGAYAASKFALEALSDALRRELLLYDVDVIVIEPGAIQSEIWRKEPDYTADLLQGDYATALARFRAMAQRNLRSSQPADTVARVVQRALEARRPRARYLVLDRPLTGWWLPRLLPARAFDRLAARFMGLHP